MDLGPVDRDGVGRLGQKLIEPLWGASAGKGDRGAAPQADGIGNQLNETPRGLAGEVIGAEGDDQFSHGG